MAMLMESPAAFDTLLKMPQPPTSPKASAGEAPEDGVCPWCGGAGLDIVTGEPCAACAADAPTPCSAERAGGRRRRPTRSGGSGKASLRSFLASSQCAASQTRPRRRPTPLLAAVELPQLHLPEDEGAGAVAGAEAECEGPAADAERSCKVRFDLDGILEFPVTPYKEVYAKLEGLLPQCDEESAGSEEEV
mmetsp:Transcript_125315/g.348684  ORF Transcript_125315/g.348684 Transcript_125315/m.348684 type:complete len:191 (+) Transcript_125315:98-670(+)|eukprot:CAMPEP_0179101672 /NCGR_PEP_ID=MMETSP0796-20121207/47020_1 /TAXON_ID=73915 /ORGANISM="Pyrodinium bahamense, Strain pbaha01" /LENGTH=190 /DNA_ID=CAMNT_0020799529 /DNA_START=93 /DNA_END=665 /DNA_ORIENTATION=-